MKILIHSGTAGGTERHKGGGAVPLVVFADIFGLTMIVRERSSVTHGEMRYYANFESFNVVDGGFLVGAYSNGATPDDAMNAYAKRISGQEVSFGIGGRVRITAPVLAYPSRDALDAAGGLRDVIARLVRIRETLDDQVVPF